MKNKSHATKFHLPCITREPVIGYHERKRVQIEVAQMQVQTSADAGFSQCPWGFYFAAHMKGIKALYRLCNAKHFATSLFMTVYLAHVLLRGLEVS